MSYSLNIHIWLGSDKATSISSYMSVFDCVSITGFSNEVVSRFRVFDQPFSLQVDKTESLNYSEIKPLLTQYWGNERYIAIDTEYPIMVYDQTKDKIINAFYPLDIEFYGINYGENCYYHKRFGHIELSFQNVGNFAIPSELPEKARTFSDAGENSEKYLVMISQLGMNYDRISKLIRKIAEKIDPLHVIACTESDVNPLVSHSIYHRDIEDFTKDLVRIALLHEFGGSYFSVLENETSTNLPPWKEASGYGYLRGKFGDNSNECLKEKLEHLSNFVLLNREWISLPIENIAKELELNTDTSSEKIGRGYLLTSFNAPFSYLEDIYFRIYRRIIDRSQQS